MSKDEELEILLEVLREQPIPKSESNLNKNVLEIDDKTLKELTDMVEVRNVNFSIEQKLDTLLYQVGVLLTGQQVLVTRVAQIEERLAKEEVNISSPISVKSEGDKSVDISKHLYELANKVQRRKSEPKRVTNEEFIQRLKEVDWSKIVETKPTIRLLDDKGNVINFECQIKDDGSITYVNKDVVIVDWS